MSEIKVNKISPRTACGTTTLGDSGDTFTIPAGVSITNSGTASGFGATGAASWNTTVKTGDFTAVNGEGYFVNTTSGAVNVTLPAGTAGAVVAIKDYAGTFDTNKVTLVRNGSDKIGGQATNGTLDVEGIAVTLVFIDSTQGWLVTDSGLQSEAPTASFISATGGTITEDGNFKVHTFTGPGTFTVSSVGNPEGSTTADYLIVAGGGSGAPDDGGGGGAGGMRFSATTYCSPSPLKAPAAFTVSATGYPVVVGGGGAGVPQPGFPNGNTGNNSSVFSLTSTGGGFGASNRPPTRCGGAGGSGGGSTGPSCGGPGNNPPVSPPQGNNGGYGPQGSGGGGIGGVGTNGTNPTNNAGGPGLAISITGSPVTYAVGGTGDCSSVNTPNQPANSGNGSAGTNSGASGATTGNGGSGIVVIRYKFRG
jgi:hypothetical protein